MQSLIPLEMLLTRLCPMNLLGEDVADYRRRSDRMYGGSYRKGFSGARNVVVTTLMTIVWNCEES